MNLENALSNLSRSLDSYLYYMNEEKQTISPALEMESTTEVPDALIFQFSIAEIFEDAKLLSAMIAKYAYNDKGDGFDSISITEEDKLIFDRFCRPAAYYGYSKIQGLAKAIYPAFMFDEGVVITDWIGMVENKKGEFVRRNKVIYKALADVTSDPEVDVVNWTEMPDYVDTKGKITFLIVNKSTFDMNVIRVWNDNLKDIVTNYILEKIFKFRNLGQEILAVPMSERMTKEQELTNTIHSRKTPIKRYVSWP